MPWHIARCVGRESRACVYLLRAGIRRFWLTRHVYFIDRRTKEERYRVLSRWPGYVLIELKKPEDWSKAKGAIGVADIFHEAIPDHYVTDLIDHGPLIENKQNTKGRLEPNQKVKIAIGAISDVEARFKALDAKGKAVVEVNTLGGVYEVTVAPERLQAAE
jgi:transcription antitermination factor NusG